MAQRSHVPKFGNWESEENVPYTVYFDKARKGRTGGKMINPNDPQENPDMFPNIEPPAQAPPARTRTEPEEPTRRGAVRTTHEHQVSKGDGDLRQFAESPARNDNMGRRVSGESAHQRHGGPHEHQVSKEDGDLRQFTESPARNDNMGRRVSGESAHQRHGGRGSSSGQPVRQSVGSEHSIERSPLHPHHQAKIVGKGSASPSWEGKNLYDGSHGTPGRSRMKPRGDETPDRGAAVPKFGEWDESNPSSADGYTHIFNRVREERHTGPGNAPGVGNQPSYANAGKQNNYQNTNKSCCFL